MVTLAQGAKMERVAEGIYRRNGVYIVPIWNPERGRAGLKDWHRLGGRCPCGAEHPGSTLRDAKALKRRLEERKSSGRRRGVQRTVGEWAGRFDESEPGRAVWVPGQWLVLAPRKAESTNIHNDERVRSFSREFADRSLASITEEEAAGFIAEHPGFIKELHAMFNDAVRLRLIDSNPFGGISVPSREGRSEIVVLSEDELEQLKAIARAIHGRRFGELFAGMIAVAAWTGVRPGELFRLSLERGDRLNFADLARGTLHVDWASNTKTGKVSRPKNESTREVPILPGAEDALQRLRRGDWQQPGQPLFLTKRGQPFTQRSHFYYWSRVRDAFAASLPPGHHIRQRGDDEDDVGNLDFYELRHFFGTKLAHPPAGVTPASPYEIAALMGHKDGGKLAMKRYIHVDSQEAKTSVGRAWRRAS